MPAETIIQLRQGTATDWQNSNGGLGAVLASGELGLDTTNGLIKIGDGAKAWNDSTLKYLTDVSRLVGSTLPTTITTATGITSVETLTNLTVTNTINGNSATATKLLTLITVNGTTLS